uniref:Ferritin isoform 2 n=1 Tax=Bombyx mori TaxID=7091 RepID=Q1HQ01_BOMMO|nr:ferritin isoform 2 [Bombyx mori]
MKVYALIVACLALGVLAEEDSCYQNVDQGCRRTLSLPHCSAYYGQFKDNHVVANELKALASLYLKRSYHYLLSASYFNNYQTNREGFAKLFRKLSEPWPKPWTRRSSLPRGFSSSTGKSLKTATSSTMLRSLNTSRRNS